MDVQSTRRAVVDRSLKLLRLPADTATRFLPDGERGPRRPAMLAIDRVDATVRDAIGAILRDDTLRDDARRRRAAADERERAIALEVAAEATARDAERHRAEAHESAEERRARAEHAENQAKQAVEREKQERK